MTKDGEREMDEVREKNLKRLQAGIGLKTLNINKNVYKMLHQYLVFKKDSV